MAPLSSLPATREGWITLLKTALSQDIIPLGSYKSPLYFFPRVATDGSVVTNWGRQTSNTQAGKKDEKLAKQSAVLMLLTPVEFPAAAATTSNVPRTVPSLFSPPPPTASSPSVVKDLVFTLTMRSGSLRSHSSQMAFPGGRCDKLLANGERVDGGSKGDAHGHNGAAAGGGDALEWTWEDSETTAQREALEEVGISSDQYTILGKLRPLYSTPSKSWVTPVVAIANPSPALGSDASSGAPTPSPSSSSPCYSKFPLLAPLPPAVRPIVASPAEVASIHYLSLTSLLQHSRHSHHHNVRYYPFSAAMERAGGLDRSLATANSSSNANSGAAAAAIPTATNSGHLSGHATSRVISSGELTGFMLPCFYAQDNDPFALSCASAAVRESGGACAAPPYSSSFSSGGGADPIMGSTEHIVFTGANGLPRGMSAAERAASEACRVASGAVPTAVAEDVEAHTAVVMVATTEGATPLGTPNCYEDEKTVAAQRAALGLSPLHQSGSPQTTPTVPARCKALHYMHERDPEGFTLVWGLTAFMLCELIARVTAARMVLGGGWGARLSKDHPVDLTPMLACSDVIARDPSYPYGPKHQKALLDANKAQGGKGLPLMHVPLTQTVMSGSKL